MLKLEPIVESCRNISTAESHHDRRGADRQSPLRPLYHIELQVLVSISVAITCRGCFAYSIFTDVLARDRTGDTLTIEHRVSPVRSLAKTSVKNGIGKTSSASYCNTN